MVAQGRPTSVTQQIESFLLPVSRAFTNAEQAQPIFFQFFPTLSSDTDSANYEDIGGDIIGRAEPMSIYRNGQAKELTLGATFAAVDDLYDEYWVQKQVHRLKALTKPIYDRANLFDTGAGKFFAPPLVIFSYGARFINVPVVIKSVSVDVPEGAMLTNGDALPQVVTVEIQMKTNYPYGYVPGYLNTFNLFTDNPSDRINPEEHSFGGNISVPSDVRNVLVDAALPAPRTWQETRGQRGLLDNDFGIFE